MKLAFHYTYYLPLGQKRPFLEAGSGFFGLFGKKEKEQKNPGTLVISRNSGAL
jgi:hypothetical protein